MVRGAVDEVFLWQLFLRYMSGCKCCSKQPCFKIINAVIVKVSGGRIAWS